MGTIQLKRGLQVNFGGVTLLSGEPCFTLDENKFYIGNGTEKVLINNPNVETAKKLATARLITVTGDANGNTSFDGSANASITLTLANTGVLAGTYTKVTVDSKGRITNASNITVADIPQLPFTKIDGLGTASRLDVGTASGQIPVLGSDGKLAETIIPKIAISDTFIVSNQTEMLGLTAEVGDIAIRTDLNKTFILKAMPPSTLSNWQELLTPTSPVQSVNGQVGTVVLTKADLGLGNVTNESKATMFTNPVFTGKPTAPTPTLTDNSTTLATTQYVQGQGYLKNTSPIDGGTF